MLQRHLEAILRASPVEEANLRELEIFSDRLIDVVAKLEDNDQHQELTGISALYIAVQQKIPESLLVSYQEWLHRKPRKDGLTTFSKWLQKQVVYRMVAEDVNERRKKKEGRKAGDVVLRTFPVWLVGPEGQAIKGNAFLDDGSDSTYVRDNIITALGLVTDERNLTLSTLTESYVPLRSKKVTLTIKGLDGETKSIVEAWTLHEMYQGLSIPDWNQHKIKWDHLKTITSPKAPDRNTIDILVGLDHPELSLALSECYGSIGEPVARKTPLGWTCVGRLPALPSAKIIAFVRTFRTQTLCETRLEEQLREMIEHGFDVGRHSYQLLAEGH